MKRFLISVDGVSLVESDDGMFAVGIYCSVGDSIRQNPRFDFCLTLDLSVARAFFNNKTGKQ